MLRRGTNTPSLTALTLCRDRKSSLWLFLNGPLPFLGCGFSFIRAHLARVPAASLCQEDISLLA